MKITLKRKGYAISAPKNRDKLLEYTFCGTPIGAVLTYRNIYDMEFTWEELKAKGAECIPVKLTTIIEELVE